MKIFYAADVIFKDARIGDNILDLHFNMKELNKKYEFSFNIENSKFPPSPFIVACAMGNLNDVKFFYDYYYTNGKMNIEHQKDLLRYEGIGFLYGYTGLMAAAKHDCVDVVKFLIEKGADCSQVCTSNSCNALQWNVLSNIKYNIYSRIYIHMYKTILSLKFKFLSIFFLIISIISSITISSSPSMIMFCCLNIKNVWICIFPFIPDPRISHKICHKFTNI